ncbi:hypothetical protein TELCIR_05143 [Teladorsagia circumcincta]|uniref:Uncharacterized protein n=1 Tax=Teladorsagia circumcincta TaxID=45464 RepID=A0A2G9URY7_TELCI|nr:hypothetical protein TELCIR_05143 [Teladorsagia circumcincta]
MDGTVNASSSHKELWVTSIMAYPSLDDARHSNNAAYVEPWQYTPHIHGPYQKRWANQVRFGKRASSWASSVRFG